MLSGRYVQVFGRNLLLLFAFVPPWRWRFLTDCTAYILEESTSYNDSQIDVHKCSANSRLESVELMVWLCVDIWCTMCCFPRYSVPEYVPYLAWFVYVQWVLFCFQTTATCARSILTNQKQKFILSTMMMLHTASVARLAWMCTSWQTGRLFRATGARWGLMFHYLNR